jgi:hypothetical protein
MSEGKVIKLYGTKPLSGEIFIINKSTKQIINPTELDCCKNPFFSIQNYKLLLSFITIIP